MTDSRLIPPHPTRFAPGAPDPLRHQLLATLAQHRMATTEQLRLLLRPHATRQAVSEVLQCLYRQELAAYTQMPDGRTRAWYLTPDGARITRDLPAQRGRPPYPITSTNAASPKTSHTLASVRAHLTFVADARRRGDEHSHLDWTPEVFHQIGEGERLIADAVMHYTVDPDGQRTKLRAFVEIDRATSSSERLAAKLIAYARFRYYEPVPVGRRRSGNHQAVTVDSWQRWYPAFPRILFILTGAAPRTLTNRIQDLRAMVREHPAVAALARDVALGAAILEDLEDQGPSGPVWVPLAADGSSRSWMGL
ncbi:replication-relaxation family protein [Streptomyces sp. NPDC058595]|uniref:replication-relaxation family protein n=1 Tax=Streptomyces sp. NPDC058595 TaxID=3346550 RepID=UPI00364CCD47